MACLKAPLADQLTQGTCNAHLARADATNGIKDLLPALAAVDCHVAALVRPCADPPDRVEGLGRQRGHRREVLGEHLGDRAPVAAPLGRVQPVVPGRQQPVQLAGEPTEGTRLNMLQRACRRRSPRTSSRLQSTGCSSGSHSGRGRGASATRWPCKARVRREDRVKLVSYPNVTLLDE